MAPQERSAARGLTGSAGNSPLVFSPAAGPGAGIGHLTRCLSLMDAVGERGFLCLDRRAYEERPEIRAFVRGVPANRLLLSFDDLPSGACVVFDSRETDPSALAAVVGRALAAGLDEGGKARERFPVLFDTLPMLTSGIRPNADLFPLRPPTGGPRPFRFPFRKLLVAFGGEDRAGLSGRLLAALLAAARVQAGSVAAVEGPLFGPREWPAGVEVIRDCRDLPALLDRFDLVFTHYGLTAYECLSRGVPVVLFNPSSYHRRLALREGLPEIGVNRVDRAALKRLLDDPEEHERALEAFHARTAGRAVLADAIRSFKPAGSPVCPVCGGKGGRVLERFELKTYIRCPRCRTIRLIYWGPPKCYSDDYFEEEYRAQYGKTYLDDFAHIKAMGAARFARIEKWAAPASGGAVSSLLDVGAAFGPFLAAAGERGYEAVGLEYSPAGAEYVRRELGIDCLSGDFLSEEIGVRLGEKRYDIITMWYVIEHFVPTGEALDRVRRLLKPGGLFALAIPSGSGVSFRKNRRRFLEQSPSDHFTIWTLSAARRALALHGFETLETVVTGHHPERFFAKPAGRFRIAAARLASRLFGMGDTFEIYARTTEDRP
ncbi:MAG: methyltransferase domain-containing protein [Spirochaetales bacterium]|nr:methyltransferase domain-containing protein [Spirochaetales bacterium]